MYLNDISAQVIWEEIKYFKEKEFYKGSDRNIVIDPIIVLMLDEVRSRHGKAIVISSGVRTIEHNKKVGGVPSSDHVHGLAVDFVCKNSKDRASIVKHLLKVSEEWGISIKVILYDRHIHLGFSNYSHNLLILKKY